MSERNMNLIFSSGISSITERNSSFDSGILRVCYTGQNRNGSFISKETFERCMSSIYNCPIVCRYDRETDTIGAHDMELVSNDDGGLKIVNVTHPVGVVPEGAQIFWEEIEDYSGLHEYLCVEVLLWKRQEAYEKIKRDGITDESMEITVLEGGSVDGVYVIDRFEFTAFCLLGTAEPCYESASLETFSLCNDFKSQLADMMQDLKQSFSLAQSSQEVVINTKIHSEGGEEVLEQKTALMAEFGLTVEDLDFNIDDFSIEELREKFEVIKDKKSKTDESDSAEQFALAEQFLNELLESLGSEKIETCFGEMTRYHYVDYDAEASEVYCYDAEDWKLYGMPYSTNGDVVSVDFAGKKRKKFSIVDFDEGEQVSVFAKVFDGAAAKLAEVNSQWEDKYQTASDTISSMESELGTLRQFKTDTENAITEGKRNEVFAQFEDLVGVEAFEELREHRGEYSLEELEEKCFAIRGRQNPVVKFGHEPKAPKLPVEKSQTGSEPYGGIFAKYGIGN